VGLDQIQASIVNLDTSATLATTTTTVPTAYPSLVLADSPTVYYRMDNSGTTLTDSSGNGRTGSMTGSALTKQAPGLLSGDPDTALGFPGTSGNYAVSGTIPSWGDVFSLECWFQRQRTTAGTSEFLFSQNFGTNNNPVVYIDNVNAGAITLRAIGASTICTSNVTVANTAVHHLVVTKNGSAVHIYLDGNDVTGSVTNYTFGSYNTYCEFGGYQNGSQSQYLGIMDEAAVYLTALSQARVQAHYNNAISANAVAQVTTPWTFAPSMSVNAGLQVANLTGARGNILSATLEVQYA
jgi:hypothetical protein